MGSYHAHSLSAKEGSVRPLLRCGDPRLAEVATAVGDPESVAALSADLLATLRWANGVGIAAPQIGVGSQVIVVASRPNPRYPDAPTMDPVVMINPQILAQTSEQVWGEEGCLSVPDRRGEVARSTALEVGFWDPQGHWRQQEWSGFVARIIQHEVDHLRGILFLDRQPKKLHWLATSSPDNR